MSPSAVPVLAKGLIGEPPLITLNAEKAHMGRCKPSDKLVFASEKPLEVTPFAFCGWY